VVQSFLVPWLTSRIISFDILSFNKYIYRYGRRPVMNISFILMILAGFLCAFGPQSNFGVWPSYIIFVIARFLLACSTRGISESGFVLGSEMGNVILRLKSVFSNYS
jgi:MFS family permease